jgi:hypothetical protein
VETVFYLFPLLLGPRGTGVGAAGAGPKLALKSVQHFRNMIVELPTGKRTPRGLSGVGIGRLPPSKHNSLLSRPQVVAKGAELLAGGSGHASCK